MLIGPALRFDVMDDVLAIAKEATERLCRKLEDVQGTGNAVDMEEEFRLLTLQVLILSRPMMPRVARLLTRSSALWRDAMQGPPNSTLLTCCTCFAGHSGGHPERGACRKQ